MRLRTERRFVRRRWARRWMAWRLVLAGLLAVALAAAAAWLVLLSDVLSVGGVVVEGTAVVDPREVRRMAAVPTGAALATVDLDVVAERVERLAPVLDAEVSRAWPDRVRIDVTERTAVAVVAREAGFGGLDADGVVFRGYPSRPPSLPLVRSALDTPAVALAEAAMVLEALPGDLVARVDHVAVHSVDTITLSLRDGRTVRWGSAEESQEKARVLPVLLEQRASAYDVSVPGQPVIRP